MESTVVNTEPVVFDMNPVQANETQEMYAQTPGVFFHHAGHTHRNHRTLSTTASQVVFQEVAATKEYPGGFSLLRVHEGGFAMNFYKTRSALAREWSERTRQEYFGGYPFYTAGSVGDRNYMVERDLSGLTAAASASTTGGPSGASGLPVSTSNPTTVRSPNAAGPQSATMGAPSRLSVADTGADASGEVAAGLALTASGLALTALARATAGTGDRCS